MNRHELFKKMQKIVEKNVEHHQSDFETDKDMLNEWGKPCWGVWVVRNHGTQLMRFTDSVMSMDYINAVISTMGHGIRKMYFIETNRDGSWEMEELKGDLEEIRTTILKRYRDMDHYKITVYATDDYRYQVREVVGGFTSIIKAEALAEDIKKHNKGKSFTVEAVRV